MNPNRPELVRALAAAAGLVLVVGLIGAVTVDGDDETVSATRDRTTTTTTLAEEATTTVVDTGAGTAPTTATTAGSATTRTTAAANVPDPGQARPTAPGTYVYSMTNSADPELNGDTERKVEELPTEAGAPRRRQTQKDVQGNTQADEIAWSNDGIRISVSRITSGGATIECKWQPPLLIAQLPLSVGKTWKSDSSCTASVAGSQVTLRRVAEAKITGKALDDVGGEKVATWVIESTSTITVRSAFFNDDTKSTSTSHFAAPRGLITLDSGTIERSSGKDTYELRLKNLTPK